MKWLQADEEIEQPAPKAIKTGPTPNLKYDDNEPHCHLPNIGEVVAVPFTNNEKSAPDFWLGKCLRVNQEDGTLLLGWFQEIDKTNKRYKMKIGASWSEVNISLIHIH
jgi:hypothetical protein